MSSEILWAPWRLDYIKEPDRKPEPPSEECFLCRYREDPASDQSNYVVLRGETTFVVLNRYPYNNGHLLIAPMEHKGRLDELSQEELMGCLNQMRQMTLILEARLKAQGFNIGLNLGRVAGAGLPGHLHWHVVPRWNGDSNFMPVVANTKVIPQSLEALYSILKQSV